MNYSAEDEPFPTELWDEVNIHFLPRQCDYTFTNNLFDWYCTSPAHPHQPDRHYMQPCVRADAS